MERKKYRGFAPGDIQAAAGYTGRRLCSAGLACGECVRRAQKMIGPTKYSARQQYPFVAVSASIPDTLIESELFGYAPNSFTGASTKGKRGLIEIANHGTVFLDDVDALPPNFQLKLLHVLQEREIIQVGGDAPRPVDVRFIVSTNQDLKKMVADGKFRNDLYFRLNVLHLHIPPLRRRPEDIPKSSAKGHEKLRREDGKKESHCQHLKKQLPLVC